MVYAPLSTPSAWEAARLRHVVDPGTFDARVFAKRWIIAVEAAVATAVHDSEVRVVATGELLCSDVCTALLIQKLLDATDPLTSTVVSRYLENDIIDLGAVRIHRLNQPVVGTYNCIVDGTLIDGDGPHYETSCDLWTEENAAAEALHRETWSVKPRPIAYMTPGGAIYLYSQLRPITDPGELSDLLKLPPHERHPST